MDTTHDNARERTPYADMVSARLRAERGDKQLTLDGLAEAAGIPKATLRRILSGERVADVSQLVRLCRALGLQPSKFLEDVERRLDGADPIVPATPQVRRVTAKRAGRARQSPDD
ncbi:helix-turn-helix domain-containing protein [Luteipulveratus mongoliensis]|uniref:HTH cro/C1-type domain-containing protein n=1 Tax=Luteipulveratus mongoliensis TaxID=571913 RepID=A0A0K1JGE7_9MICO|nr:helix-turn-helix transcriptional regulator [Luteipulveratus mongoliensis]AKU15787.1 hypothetical protein VV02_07830 [Luteipulveratus mongoliensis]